MTEEWKLVASTIASTATAFVLIYAKEWVTYRIERTRLQRALWHMLTDEIDVLDDVAEARNYALRLREGRAGGLRQRKVSYAVRLCERLIERDAEHAAAYEELAVSFDFLAQAVVGYDAAVDQYLEARRSKPESEWADAIEAVEAKLIFLARMHVRVAKAELRVAKSFPKFDEHKVLPRFETRVSDAERVVKEWKAEHETRVSSERAIRSTSPIPGPATKSPQPDGSAEATGRSA